MKKIEVQIMGQSYVLTCTSQTEPRLRHAVAKVDAAMCQIRDAGKLRARERIAVLAALNIAATTLEVRDSEAASLAPLPDPLSASSPIGIAANPNLQQVLPQAQLRSLSGRIACALDEDSRSV